MSSHLHWHTRRQRQEMLKSWVFIFCISAFPTLLPGSKICPKWVSEDRRTLPDIQRLCKFALALPHRQHPTSKHNSPPPLRGHAGKRIISKILRGGSSTLEMAGVAHGWLQYTFSPDPQERRQAEIGLRDLEAKPGILTALLTIVNRRVRTLLLPTQCPAPRIHHRRTRLCAASTRPSQP